MEDGSNASDDEGGKTNTLPPAHVIIHSSQFPDTVRQGLFDCIRSENIKPKYLYDSVLQTQKWLTVHRMHSPIQSDPNVVAIYDQAFEMSLESVVGRETCLVGLGCGSGEKDARFLRKLKTACAGIRYVPCDVSPAMTLTARKATADELPVDRIHPLVCDLANSGDLNQVLDHMTPVRDQHIFTFFGMIPNIEPGIILPKLRDMMQRDDLLLLSANMVPGVHYDKEIEAILPQYDNPETRDWLLSFLVGLGIDPAKGRLRFEIENGKADRCGRIVADFIFSEDLQMQVDDESFEFLRKKSLRLFFSNRHTPDSILNELEHHGLDIRESWISTTGEEGVFLVQKQPHNEG